MKTKVKLGKLQLYKDKLTYYFITTSPRVTLVLKTPISSFLSERFQQNQSRVDLLAWRFQNLITNKRRQGFTSCGTGASAS